MVDRPGNGRGDGHAVLATILVDGEQRSLEDEDVIARFHGEKIDSSSDEGRNLLVVVCHEVVERERSRALVRATGFDVERLGGRTDAAGDEAGLVWVAPRVVVGCAARQFGRAPVDLEDMIL